MGTGAEECGADVPKWDFDWQLTYMYAEPIELALDDRVRVTCVFDTSAVTEPTLPGWGTENEMCLMGMVLSVE